jgi:hypothetical protein
MKLKGKCMSELRHTKKLLNNINPYDVSDNIQNELKNRNLRIFRKCIADIAAFVDIRTGWN